MNLAIIGNGAIGRYVRHQLIERKFRISALLVRPTAVVELARQHADIKCITTVADLPDHVDHVIDCAGHTALRSFGPDILRLGVDLTTVSIGALADAKLYSDLEKAADDGQSRLHLACGAIGALDCLRAAGVGQLRSVTYVGRKPPLSWKGSPAEQALDLARLGDKPAVHFSGSARDAATRYPQNANVAAAVALAGIGFDDTKVELIADPHISENIHTLTAEGEFGRFEFEIQGRSLPDNPKSSALAAMSVVSKLEQESRRVRF